MYARAHPNTRVCPHTRPLNRPQQDLPSYQTTKSGPRKRRNSPGWNFYQGQPSRIRIEACRSPWAETRTCVAPAIEPASGAGVDLRTANTDRRAEGTNPRGYECRAASPIPRSRSCALTLTRRRWMPPTAPKKPLPRSNPMVSITRRMAAPSQPSKNWSPFNLAVCT